MGNLEVQDQNCAVAYFAARGLIDPTRVGEIFLFYVHNLLVLGIVHIATNARCLIVLCIRHVQECLVGLMVAT